MLIPKVSVLGRFECNIRSKWLSLKANLHGMIFPFDRRMRLLLFASLASHHLQHLTLTLTTASREEEDYYRDAFMAILTNKIEIEKDKAKLQINI